jgi:diacylglycerol kinase
MQGPVKTEDVKASSEEPVRGPDSQVMASHVQGWAPYMRSTSLISSIGYASQGIAHAFRTQRNFKFHAAITLIVVIAALAVHVSLGEWEALAVVIGLVFQTELTNTAVEAIVDKVSPEFHELAKIAKDCSAAAVLVTAIAATIVGMGVFGHHVLALLALVVH